MKVAYVIFFAVALISKGSLAGEKGYQLTEIEVTPNDTLSIDFPISVADHPEVKGATITGSVNAYAIINVSKTFSDVDSLKDYVAKNFCDPSKVTFKNARIQLGDASMNLVGYQAHKIRNSVEFVDLELQENHQYSLDCGSIVN